jgi:segregation and condensation protein A
MDKEYRVQLEVFEGPLDLLLRLIEREELDITTVSLAKVTDQYVAYLRDLEKREVRDLADFLVVAAKLLLIKSLALLPRPRVLAPEAEDIGDELVQQLIAYKRYKEVASLLREREQEGLRGFVRIAPMPRAEPQLELGEVTIGDLLVAVQDALDAAPALPAGEVVAAITVTIAEQQELIQKRLARGRRLRFRDVLSQAASRVEVIVTLLALLELIKRDAVDVWQEEPFGTIYIKRREPEEAAAGQAPVEQPAS